MTMLCLSPRRSRVFSAGFDAVRIKVGSLHSPSETDGGVYLVGSCTWGKSCRRINFFQVPSTCSWSGQIVPRVKETRGSSEMMHRCTTYTSIAVYWEERSVIYRGGRIKRKWTRFTVRELPFNSYSREYCRGCSSSLWVLGIDSESVTKDTVS